MLIYCVNLSLLLISIINLTTFPLALSLSHAARMDSIFLSCMFPEKKLYIKITKYKVNIYIADCKMLSNVVL